MDRIIFQLLSLPHICKNDKQIKAIINSLTRKQKYKIQRFIRNILNGKIPLNDAEYRKLSKHKTFIRSLKGGKVNVKSLLRNYNIFSEIINVMLTNSKNESNEKNDFGSFRRMEKDECFKNKKSKRKNETIGKIESTRKITRNEENFSGEDSSDNESYISSTGEEENMEEEEENITSEKSSSSENEEQNEPCEEC